MVRYPEIALDDYVHGLKYSSNGKLLAVHSGEFLICDLAENAVKYVLSGAKANALPRVNCHGILDIDEEGCAWAVVTALPGAGANKEPAESVLAKFAPDGSKWEPVIAPLRVEGTACLSTNRRWLAVTKRADYGRGAMAIEVWDVVHLKKVKDLSGDWSEIDSLVFAHDNKKVASSGTWSNMIKVWSLGGVVSEPASAVESPQDRARAAREN
jgi:hypothetical protein